MKVEGRVVVVVVVVFQSKLKQIENLPGWEHRGNEGINGKFKPD